MNLRINNIYKYIGADENYFEKKCEIVNLFEYESMSENIYVHVIVEFKDGTIWSVLAKNLEEL